MTAEARAALFHCERTRRAQDAFIIVGIWAALQGTREDVTHYRAHAPLNTHTHTFLLPLRTDLLGRWRRVLAHGDAGKWKEGPDPLSGRVRALSNPRLLSPQGEADLMADGLSRPSLTTPGFPDLLRTSGSCGLPSR